MKTLRNFRGSGADPLRPLVDELSARTGSSKTAVIEMLLERYVRAPAATRRRRRRPDAISAIVSDEAYARAQAKAKKEKVSLVEALRQQARKELGIDD